VNDVSDARARAEAELALSDHGLPLIGFAPASPPQLHRDADHRPAEPVITEAVLDQWEGSAEQDAERGETWSTNPRAMLVVIREVRTGRALREALGNLTDAAEKLLGALERRQGSLPEERSALQLVDSYVGGSHLKERAQQAREALR
jgi:hypothetical protein